MFNKLKQTKEIKKQTKELEQNVERLRQVIKSSFYPWLKTNSTSVEEASIFCQVFAGHIHSCFNIMAKKIKLSEMDLTGVFQNDEDKKKFEEVLAMVKDETVNDALMIFEGMPKAIGSCVNKELKSRKLEELTELEKDFA